MKAEVRQKLMFLGILSAPHVVLTFSRTLIMVGAIFVLQTSNVIAGNGRGGTSVFPILDMVPAARPAGMGEAFTAYGDDINAFIFNPAGIADLVGGQISLSHAIWFQDINFEYFALAMPLTFFKINVKGSFGLSYSLLHTPKIPRTELAPGFDEIEGLIDLFTPGETGFSFASQVLELGAATEFSKDLDVGIKFKIPRQTVADSTVSGFAFTVGAIATVDSATRAGLVIRNLGGAVGDAVLPTTFALGFSRRFFEISGPNDDLVFAMDTVLPIKPTDTKPKARVGIEYNRKLGTKGVSIRAGYRHGYDLGTLAGLTLGAGVGSQFGRGIIKLDYAFMPQGELGSISRMSMTATF